MHTECEKERKVHWYIGFIVVVIIIRTAGFFVYFKTIFPFKGNGVSIKKTYKKKIYLDVYISLLN